MSSVKQFYRKCDKCGAWSPLGLENSQKALAFAKRHGWTRKHTKNGWEDRCPKCGDRK